MDGDKINSFLDKPHYRLASKQEVPSTQLSVLESKELVANDVNPSLQQLQIIYYLKSRDHQSLLSNELVINELDRNNRNECSKTSQLESVTANTNRIVISRKRKVSTLEKDNKKTGTSFSLQEGNHYCCRLIHSKY